MSTDPNLLDQGICIFFSLKEMQKLPFPTRKEGVRRETAKSKSK
jgi:hypothetical protein